MLGFTTKKMTVKEFIKIPDNPIQRNTKIHALKSARPNGHLAVYSPTHFRVAIAQTKNGRQKWKLDGHSRCYLWENEKLEEPSELLVDIFEVKNKQAAIDLYLTYDSQGATENSSDKLFGAMKYHGFTPTTMLYRNSGMLTAMRYLAFPILRTDLRNLPTTELVEPWIETLQIIDNSSHCIAHPQNFPGWVMMAMMLTVRRDKSIAMSFWEAYQNDEGVKHKKSTDGIYAARQLHSYVSENRYSFSSSNALYRDYTTSMLHLYQQWKDGKKLPTQGHGVSRWGIVSSVKFPAISKWWKENIGEYDYPQIRKQQGLDLEDETS